MSQPWQTLKHSYESIFRVLPHTWLNTLLLLSLWVLPLAFLGLFFFYPLNSILEYSFARGESSSAATLLEVIQTPSLWRVLGFTTYQAALSTILTLMFGLPGAYLMARYQFRGKSVLLALTGIPFVMPTLVVASAFSALLGPKGWANLALMQMFDLAAPPIQFTNTFTAILVAHVFYNTTIILRTVGDFWAHLDPRLEQAAKVLGADRFTAFRRITIPLLAPALAAAALLVFIFDFTSFGVVLVLGGPQFATLEVEIYYQTISLFNLPVAAALSLIQILCTLLFTVIYTQLSNRLTRPLTYRPASYTQKRLLNWKSRFFAGVVILLLIGVLTLPLLALAARSVTQLPSNQAGTGGFTLSFFQELFVNRRQSLFYAPPAAAIGVSLGYATLTVFFALLLGLPAAWALARRSEALLNRLLDPLVMLPLGASSVTIGLGFILAFSRPPLDLRTSLFMVPLAHTLVALPFVIRSLTPSLRAIRPQLRQAAQVLGASPWQEFRRVELPLISRALLAAAIFAFTTSLGEFGATAMIARPEYPTIPTIIYRMLGQPGALNYGQAMALSTILMFVCAGGMFAIERLRLEHRSEF
jgi:thiamine transport system permease protein